MLRKPSKATINGLELVGPTTWAAVYRQWYGQEGRRLDWRRHYLERCHRSWREWRQFSIIQPFALAKKKWQIYRLDDPTKVLDWHGGPFPGWKRDYYAGAQTRSFRWLVNEGKIQKNRKVGKFKTVPPTMKLFGLRYKNKIIILDGMHRCCALALMMTKKKPVRTTIILALAQTKTLPVLKPRMV